MKIGLVTADFAPNVGGVAAHVVELGRALAALGHEVHVIAPRRPSLPGCRRWQGMVVHRPRLSRAKPLFTIQLARWLRRFVRVEHPDLLHVHGLRPLEATRGAGADVVFTNHTSGFLARVERGEAARRRVARRLEHVRHVLAPSAELVEATRACGYRGPVDFIPNGVDVERFRPDPDGGAARARLGLPPDAVVVLLARRLVAKNGCRFFGESAVHFARDHVHILVAGDGPERGALEAALGAAGALERSTFLGRVENAEMPQVYRAADVSVLPSLREATSIAGLESMASGLPLVGTRVGGIPAIIEHERTGLLVAPGDPAGLGRAIRRLADSRTERTELGARARARVVAEFAWGRIAAATAAVYASP